MWELLRRSGTWFILFHDFNIFDCEVVVALHANRLVETRAVHDQHNPLDVLEVLRNGKHHPAENMVLKETDFELRDIGEVLGNDLYFFDFEFFVDYRKLLNRGQGLCIRNVCITEFTDSSKGN